MRRALLVAGAWLLVAVPDAPAKCCAVTTPPAPHDLAAGEQWVANIKLEGDPSPSDVGRLTVIAWSESTTKLVSVDARETRMPRVYRARVVFPEPGVWWYTVTFGGFSGSAGAPVREVTVTPADERVSPRLLAAPAAAILAAVIVGGALRRRR